MPAAYVDTSWLVAITFGEPGSRALISRLESFEAVVASNLLEAEYRAACSREGRAVQAELLDRVSWILPDRGLGSEIGRVLAAGNPRGADTFHLATALFITPDPTPLSFLTLDPAQGKVARALGFQVD